MTVMETLSAYKFGAMLVTDTNGRTAWVISKKDLALTYKHGVSPLVAAHEVMSAPVHTCDTEALLEDAIKKMISLYRNNICEIFREAVTLHYNMHNCCSSG